MYNIEFVGNAPLDNDALLANVRHAKSLGLPRVRDEYPHGRRLAVVGGGPSIVGALPEIRKYSDIWAINGACGYLREHGIDSTLLTIDPVDFLAPRVAGAKKALLATRCHPKVYAVLKDCDIQTFDVTTDSDEGLWATCGTVTVSFPLALKLGYSKVDFFGCEGSFAEVTHAYMDEAELQDVRFVVECDGVRYHTAPDLYLVTKSMADILRQVIPDSFRERSGGLLRALVKNPAHQIVQISAQLEANLKEPA